MSQAAGGDEAVWRPEPKPWGKADAWAIGFWTLAIVVFFWRVVTFQKALFYFDITEINFPYRDFFASELRAGRFSRWCPGLYCGLPLYSESQAGYLHPLKYLFYPWMASWKAFSLDTVASIWLTGFGTYGWLRRHVGPSGALTGAAVFGLGGFLWAHLIHTSMLNALASVPFIVWALEVAWERGRGWPVVLGAVALACQVFAGHLQDTILTSGMVGLYSLYRAATERGPGRRMFALGAGIGLVALGIALSAVQWIPSKELLDRSPRSGGLTWDDLTYGSWNPELLPTLIVREAYGTRARDTDWPDGYYPYHEMNAYLGVIAMGLAIVGAGAYRDRWVAFWVLLTGVGCVLMLGKFTALFDYAHRIPVFGSSRIPVRYHLWVSFAVAALAAVGVDRLARPGMVRLRTAGLVILAMVVASVPILAFIYSPIWTDPGRWTRPYHLARYRWLGKELIVATCRTAVLVLAAGWIARRAVEMFDPTNRRRLAAILPVLVIVDLLGSHIADVPTVPSSYWTSPPASAQRLKEDPSFIRVFGVAKRSAGEPGYASEPIDFMSVRDALDWSIAPVWGLASSGGETPIIPKRMVEYTDTAVSGQGRLDIESVSHFVTDHPQQAGGPKGEQAGAATIIKNTRVQPRARLMGRPAYADGESGAMATLKALGGAARERVVVEDPTRPLREDAAVSGTARIVRDLPEDVEVTTESTTDAYLVLADTFDPGWSATVDGKPAMIRPAYVAFRAVYVPEGKHTVVFRYSPAGFATGLRMSGAGIAVAIMLLVRRRRLAVLEPEHGDSRWPRRWPWWGLAAVVLLIAGSAVKIDATGTVTAHSRWNGGFHPFTWGAGLLAMQRR